MQPRYPAIDGNDSRHNQTDSNMGGSPLGGKGTKNIPPVQRGGFGQNGRDPVVQRANMGGGRSGSGNPASRGGFRGEARGGASTAETRVPGHGGSPQVKEPRGGDPSMKGGGFGHAGQGQQNTITPGALPSYGSTNPKPSSGNTSGRSYQLIAGRFKRAAMGAKASSGSSGKYGSAPVTSNT